MGFYWNPWAVTGSVALFVGWGLAFLVYFTNPTRLQNRSLAIFLAFISTGFGIGVGWMFASDDVSTSLALQAVSLAGFYCALPFYLLFLSTLPTKTMKWLRPTWVRALLWVSPLVILPLMVVNFDRLVGGVIDVPYAKFDSYWTPLGTRIFEVQALTTSTLGILAAVGALVESPVDGPTRRQAKWYAATFIVWEVLQLAAFTILEVAFRSPNPSIALYTTAAGVLFPAASLLFLLMLAYSILKVQLFGIDLHIKAGLRRGLIVTPFAVAFFLVSESLEGALPFDSFWAGLAAAGVITLGLVPLQRASGRLADRIMPGVKDTPEYRERRARDIYQAAFEVAARDGTVTPREAAMLARLASELGLEDAPGASALQAVSTVSS